MTLVPRTISALLSPAFANRQENPYNWLLSTALKNHGVDVREFSFRAALHAAPDVLHLHWPEYIVEGHDTARATLRVTAFLALIDQAKARGSKLVWTVHNLRSHNQSHPRLERFLFRQLVSRLDGFLALSSSGRELALAAHPGLARVPSAITPLGHFKDYYPDTSTRSEAVTALRLPAHRQVVLSLGRLRPYKNVPSLVSAFNELDDENLLLLVAGAPSDGVDLSQISGANVVLHDYHTAESSLQFYYRAASLSVLPYRDILNSASAMLSLSFGVPVLLPRVKTMEELGAAVGANWVRLYDPPLTPSLLREAVLWSTDASRTPLPDLSMYSWNSIADTTHTFYRSLL